MRQMLLRQPGHTGIPEMSRSTSRIVAYILIERLYWLETAQGWIMITFQCHIWQTASDM